MNKDKIKTYDELEDDEKEVLDSFRKMMATMKISNADKAGSKCVMACSN